MYMYLCIHACVHAYMYLFTFICVCMTSRCTPPPTHTHIHTYIHAHTPKHTYLYAHIRVYTCVYIYICVHIYIYRYQWRILGAPCPREQILFCSQPSLVQSYIHIYYLLAQLYFMPTHNYILCPDTVLFQYNRKHLRIAWCYYMWIYIHVYAFIYT